jgi:hypothetical protein
MLGLSRNRRNVPLPRGCLFFGCRTLVNATVAAIETATWTSVIVHDRGRVDTVNFCNVHLIY